VVQAEVEGAWDRLTTENQQQYADFEGFRRAFEALFGFGIEGIDYSAPTEIDRPIPGL
jgi:enoyl-[acyl-carrier protein] reductase/trans-2-enoyl-CoA reductase (NAD+)